MSRASIFPALLLAALAGTAAVALSACSGDGAIVGGRCAQGLEACDQQCVDLSTDSFNCGACGNLCEAPTECVDGQCLALSEAGVDGDGPLVIETGPPADSSCDGIDCDGSSDAPLDSIEVDAADGGCDGGDCDASLDSDAPDDSGDLDASDADAPSEDASDANQQDASDANLQDVGTDGDAADDVSADGPDDVSADGPDDVSADGSVVDGCTPPYDNDQNCGACGVSCQDPAPTCKPDGDGGFACGPYCDPPLARCGNQCVDLQNDGEHCGSCTTVCLTGLCQAGKCRGESLGNAVIIGMNYRSWAPNSPAARAFANAVYLPPVNPVRIVEYAEYADTSANGSKVQVAALLQWAQSYKGRAYSLSQFATSADVAAGLSIDQHDLLLVHDEPTAPAGELAAIGAAWQATLTTYLRAGGSVVVLASANGINQMPAFLSSADLLGVSAVQPLSSAILLNNAPADAVGLNVQSPFLSRPDTVALATSDAPSSLLSFVVLEQISAAPVIVHRAVVP